MSDAELGVLGAQQAKADRAARRALGVAPMAEAVEETVYGEQPTPAPELGEAANLRARALDLALTAATVDIIAPEQLFATAESYYEFITGGTHG